MLRTSLLLLLVLASATVVARDLKHADANGACSSQDEERPAAAAATTRYPAASKPAKSRPSVHGDAPSRLQSPRWHSFLPGMFR